MLVFNYFGFIEALTPPHLTLPVFCSVFVICAFWFLFLGGFLRLIRKMITAKKGLGSFWGNLSPKGDSHLFRRMCCSAFAEPHIPLVFGGACGFAI